MYAMLRLLYTDLLRFILVCLSVPFVLYGFCSYLCSLGSEYLFVRLLLLVILSCLHNLLLSCNQSRVAIEIRDYQEEVKGYVFPATSRYQQYSEKLSNALSFKLKACLELYDMSPQNKHIYKCDKQNVLASSCPKCFTVIASMRDTTRGTRLEGMLICNCNFCSYQKTSFVW